jgi:hypothetical protein
LKIRIQQTADPIRNHRGTVSKGTEGNSFLLQI